MLSHELLNKKYSLILREYFFKYARVIDYFRKSFING